MKNSKILTGRLPPEDGSDWRETLGKRVSDDFAKLIFRAENFFGGVIFGKNRKFGKAVYPARMAPIGVKLWENAFQTILQK